MMDLRAVITRSLKAALELTVAHLDRGKLHAARSRNFISQLDSEFCQQYRQNDDIRVFTRDSKEDRGGFKRKELLYDLTVFRFTSIASPGNKGLLSYPTEILWQVESELKESNARAVLEDFNKLLLGSAQNKLYIGADSFLGHKDWLLPIAQKCMDLNCTHHLYLALVPHPKNWDLLDPKAEVWECINGSWCLTS